jgi:hypothetical protein
VLRSTLFVELAAVCCPVTNCASAIKNSLLKTRMRKFYVTPDQKQGEQACIAYSISL